MLSKSMGAIVAIIRFHPLESTMSQAAEALSAQATQLPPEERMEVVERILDSLDQPDAALDALWAKEADDRLAAYRRGEIKAVALSDVIAKYQVNTKQA
jgi:putative addiction module component (TIGR02574 family)